MEQKSPATGLALIHCGGDGELGYGHVKRMVALAQALRDREGISACFALHGGEDAQFLIRRAGFDARMVCAPDELAALVRTQKPDLLVLDSPGGLSRGEADAMRRDCALMAVIDDPSELRLACDFAYYPPMPQAMALGWAGARTVPRIGWEWALLGLNPHLTPARGFAIRPTLLVTMGGSDPGGLTERAARALARLDSTFRIRFVIGGGMKHADQVAAGIVAIKNNFETVEGADDLSTEYAAAELALCAFGVTAYELAAFGVPAIYLNVSEDHASCAASFQAAGMGVSLGLVALVTDEEISNAVQGLIHNAARRRDMRAAGLGTIDGGGAARIAADLAQALKEEKAPLKAAQ
jgi:spore coat polysaccharide biosynthesis protein SpsF